MLVQSLCTCSWCLSAASGLRLSELPGFSGGEHRKVPCMRETKELKNNNAQLGSLHLSALVSKRTLETPTAAALQWISSKVFLTASGHAISSQAVKMDCQSQPQAHRSVLSPGGDPVLEAVLYGLLLPISSDRPACPGFTILRLSFKVLAIEGR